MEARRVTCVLAHGLVRLGLVFAVAITPALAQTGATTGLTGRVTDATGAALRGTSVTVQSVDTGAERVVNTNDQGTWEVRFLSPGTYVLTFELTGFKTLRREGVMVSTGEMATVDVVLEVGDVTEAVEVTADARDDRRRSATVGRTLDRRELESLPTSAATSRSCWRSSQASRPTSASCSRTTTRRSRRA